MKISKRKILVSLTDEDCVRLERLRGGHSKSVIIAMAIRELELRYPLISVTVPPLPEEINLPHVNIIRDAIPCEVDF